MTTRAPFRFTTVLLAVLGAGLVVLSVINLKQRAVYQLPDDGVSWVDSSRGVSAWLVERQGPGERAGIQEGDALVSINGVRVQHWTDANQVVFHSGVWTKAKYELVRRGATFQTEVVLAPQNNSKSLRYYLDFVGLLYLFIGAYIVLRRWTAPKSVHFFTFCLASFVLYTFSYTGKLNTFDTTIYWLNVLAWTLQPALFLHFCLSFPGRPAFLERRSYVYPLLYLPGALLFTTHVLVAQGVLAMPLPPLTARWVLDARELVYLVAYFLAGAVALLSAYRRTQAPLHKQQLKWVTRGAVVAVVPFAAFYALPYSLGFIPTGWMKLSALSLILLPLTFGYAILRHRLMDVDIIFKRGIAYTLATATIVALYIGLIALLAEFFRTTVPIANRTGWILAIVVTAFLFQPVVNWIQARLDQFFNREQYDYRRTLLEFARDITSELHLGRLLDQVSERLADTLRVDRLAVFLAAEGGNGFRMVESRGQPLSDAMDLGFLDPERPDLAKGYLFFKSVRAPLGLAPTAKATVERLGLHYYLPFRVKDRTLGYLGLGKTREGDFLSSQDVDLLRTIVGYVSIALENARLYQSLEEKAHQYQTVKEFSENIIESINIGVIAFDLEHRVESWNSSMEKLYGMMSAEVAGRKLDEIFPPELLAELSRALEPLRTLTLYKFRLKTAEARERIVNISMTPLVSKEHEVMGGLLVLSDYTERVSLEEQLVQAEKLSSIGLLAAGVAHEVNTPLAVIASQAQLLSRQTPPDEARSRTLEKIIKQAFRASEIVDNLLKFSRVSGSEYAEIDLNRAIRETLSLAEPMLRASKIALNPQLTAELPGVFGNSGKLQQVFMNLIMNARDAMPRGGELTIVTETEDSTVHVEFADNGVGIPPEHLGKIFDPFFTTKSISRGTGLGLAVSYGIMREHAGRIRVESALGRGTSFHLDFPAAGKAVHVS